MEYRIIKPAKVHLEILARRKGSGNAVKLRMWSCRPGSGTSDRNGLRR